MRRPEGSGGDSSSRTTRGTWPWPTRIQRQYTWMRRMRTFFNVLSPLHPDPLLVYGGLPAVVDMGLMDGWMDGYLELCGGLLTGTQALGFGCSMSQLGACADCRIWALYSPPPPPGGLPQGQDAARALALTRARVLHVLATHFPLQSRSRRIGLPTRHPCVQGPLLLICHRWPVLGPSCRGSERKKSPRVGQKTGVG